MRDFCAYLDESDAQPGGRQPAVYVVAAAIVDTAERPQIETALRGLVTPEDRYGRLHHSRIRDPVRQRMLSDVIASLRGTSFVVASLTGYTRTKDREAVRAQVLDPLFLHLAKDRAMSWIVIEQREDPGLRAADSRVASRLQNREPVTREVKFTQARASDEPCLWIADFVAAAYRRLLVDGKDNLWTRYQPHAEEISVRWDPARREAKRPGKR